MSSNAQSAANQQNAQLSTGPTSPEGKAVAALNALQHGIYAESPVLPGENADELSALDRSYQRHFDPEGPAECALVEVLVRSQWLTHRYDAIEAAIVWKYHAESGKTANETLAELYSQTKNSPLHRVQQRRDAAQKHWFRALKELQRLQKARGKKELAPSLKPKEENGFVPQKAVPASNKPWNVPVIAPGPPPKKP